MSKLDIASYGRTKGGQTAWHAEPPYGIQYQGTSSSELATLSVKVADIDELVLLIIFTINV